MIGISALLVAAAVGFAIARWRRLPAVPFLLAAGVALNFLDLVPERRLLEDALMLGLAFLVFAAGTELNPRRVGGQRETSVRVGTAQFALLAICGFLVVRFLGAGVQEASYLALAVASSSTLLVVRMLQQRQRMFDPFGRMVLGVLLLQDLFVILLLPVLAGMSDGPMATARGLVGTALLVAAAGVVLRWVAPFLLVRLDLDEEELILATLAILFVFMGGSALLDLPIVAGAFLGGIALSAFPTSGIVRGQLSPLVTFFHAIFFTALGGLVGGFDLSDLGLALALAAVVVLLTPPIVVVIAETMGLSARAAIDAGLLLAQTSEFSLVIVLQGWAAGHLDERILGVVVLVTAFTMSLTPFVATNRMTWRLMAFHPVRRKGFVNEDYRDHILVIGAGDNGMPLVETLVGAGQRVVVVDDDPAVVEALREGDIPCIRGDGADFDVLRQAGAQHARIIISTMRRPRDSMHLLKRVGRVPVLVRVFETEDAERIREAGGIPISYADAATEDFLSWLDQAEVVGVGSERQRRPQPVPDAGRASV